MRARHGLLTVCLTAVPLLAPWAMADAADPIDIAISAPLSGPDAIFGEQLVSGVRQAITDIDASGGFLGQPAVAEPRDDGGDPKKGVDVAKAFVAAKVRFVIGPFSSAVAVPASAIYADAGTLDITPSATGPLVTDRGLARVFRTCGRADGQAVVAARYLLQRHVARIAILHDRTSAGKALADAVRDALAAEGRKDVLYASLDKGSTDASSLVSRLKASGAQVAFWGGTGAEAALIVRQIRESNAKVTLMGGLGLASDDFASAAGPAADGTLIVFPQDPKTHAAAADLLRRLQAKGKDPDGYVFYAYAAVQVLHQAAEAAGSLDPKTLAATMHSGLTFKTVVGTFTFDAKGDPVPSDLAVYVWHKGATGRMSFDDLAKT